MNEKAQQEHLESIRGLLDSTRSPGDGEGWDAARVAKTLRNNIDERLDELSQLEVILAGLQRLQDMQEQIEELRKSSRNGDCEAMVSARRDLEAILIQACTSAGLGRIIKAPADRLAPRYEALENGKGLPGRGA
jgi:hypothetical protein